MSRNEVEQFQYLVLQVCADFGSCVSNLSKCRGVVANRPASYLRSRRSSASTAGDSIQTIPVSLLRLGGRVR